MNFLFSVFDVLITHGIKRHTSGCAEESEMRSQKQNTSSKEGVSWKFPTNSQVAACSLYL